MTTLVEDIREREIGPRRGVGLGTRLFHWLTAALLLGSFAAAWTFNSLAPGQLAAQLVEIHRSIGLTLPILVIARLLWRFTHPLPALPLSTPAWERWVAKAVQASLYLCLFVMPLIGWVASNAEGDQVTFLGIFSLPELSPVDQLLSDRLFDFHATISYTLLGLIAFHVLGALRHHFIKGDNVLKSMLDGSPRGESDPEIQRSMS